MITRDEIKTFCKKHKIKEPWFNTNDPTDTNSVISMSDIDYFKKFYKRRPSDFWIYLETDEYKKEQENTKYYDPKLKHYYLSDISNKYEEYEFKAPCYMKFVLPFSTYKENRIIGLFNHILKHGDTKSNPVFGEFEYEYAPFGTIDELEYLYTVVYPKLHKDIKDFYNSESFQKTLQTYNNNIQTIKTLKKGTIELVNKSYKITTKKSVIEDEFAI